MSNLSGCSIISKRKEINFQSDFCDSYEPLSADKAMIENSPLEIRAWIARNEHTYSVIKQCEDVD